MFRTGTRVEHARYAFAVFEREETLGSGEEVLEQLGHAFIDKTE